MVISTRKLSSFGLKINKFGVWYCWGMKVLSPCSNLQQKSQHEYLNSQKIKFSSYPPHQCREDKHATTKNILEEIFFRQCLFSFVIWSKMCCFVLKKLVCTNIHGLRP
jgi:hypothetical protein